MASCKVVMSPLMAWQYVVRYCMRFPSTGGCCTSKVIAPTIDPGEFVKPFLKTSRYEACCRYTYGKL